MPARPGLFASRSLAPDVLFEPALGNLGIAAIGLDRCQCLAEGLRQPGVALGHRRRDALDEQKIANLQAGLRIGLVGGLGARLQSIVGREVDSPLYSVGPAVEVLADSAINFHGKAVTIMATYYTNAKNAGVIDISTNGWTCAIDDICPWHPQISKDTKNDAHLITEQILNGLTKGPLGVWRPAIIDVQARTKMSALQRI